MRGTNGHEISVDREAGNSPPSTAARLDGACRARARGGRGERFFAPTGRHPAAAGQPARRDPDTRGGGENRRHQHLSERPRHGDAAQDRDRAQPGGRRADQSPVHRRAAREGRGPPRRDRSAPLPGSARPVRGPDGARPGAARQRPHRPGALSHAVYAGFDRQAAGGHAGGAGAPVRGHGQGRPGPGRQRAPAARLRAHHRARRRPPGAASGGPGQRRARGRRERPRRHHAVAADHGGVHHPAGQSARRAEAAALGRTTPGRGLRPRAESEARNRRAAHGGQPDRSLDWNGQAEGAISKRGRWSFPQPVRERAHAARHPARRHARPVGGRRARRPRDFRVRDQGGRDGRAAQGERGHGRRRRLVGRIRPCAWRAGGRGRQRPPARRRESGDSRSRGQRRVRRARQGAGERRAQAAAPQRGRMNPSRLFILRPVATSLLMVAILLAGAIAYRLLPLSALPEVDYPTIQVVTFYPGASPDVATSSITAPLERQLGQMPGLKQMSSTSSGGASVITLQFSLELTLDVAEQEVQAAINAASNFLPADLPAPPVYSKVNPADAPILTLGITSKTMPLPQVQNLVDTRLAQKISQLPGVGLVTLSGGQRPAVRGQANPRALASNGLNLEDVRTAIASANVNQAKGSFDGPSRAYTIDANDQLRSAADYRAVIVAYRNGAPIQLSDVADVVEDAENVRLAAWMNELPAVILNIQRQPGANVIEVVDRVKQLLPQLTASLPASVEVATLTDRTVTIRASVKDVQFELMLAVALVVMVIFLFLRTAAGTIIPSIAVPLSLVGTFGVMYLAGFSVNNLTLMALTIATGFVVDDAIVMIENIARYIEEGEPPLQVALKGAEQIGFTIISLTFSLIAVLIPLLFMGEVVGRLFREFAITLAVAILISAVVSLTLTPMKCAKLLRL